MSALPDPRPSRRILMIDDDLELCGLVEKLLAREGLAAEFAHDGDAGLEAALRGDHEAIILDVMMPGLGGFDVLRRIRERKRTPILMLTARGDPVDRVVGLELGSDDYIPKPFDPRELVARIRAVLRRSEAPPAPATTPIEPGGKLVVGEVSVNLDAREARRGTRLLQLTPHEFELLVLLMRTPGQPVSRDEMSRAVLSRPFEQGDRLIDLYVAHLRRKLGKGTYGATLIRTVPNRGYCLSEPRKPGPR